MANRCTARIAVDWGTSGGPSTSETHECELSSGHKGDHYKQGAGTWKEGIHHIHGISEPTAPLRLDLEWARRCAAEYRDKPTDARARNAAQCLADLLDAYDGLAALLMPPQLRTPATPCRLGSWPDGWACGLPNLHTGPCVYQADPATPCPGFPQARPEDARLVCFKPAGHTGPHSNEPQVGPPLLADFPWCLEAAGPQQTPAEPPCSCPRDNHQCLGAHEPRFAGQPWGRCPNTPPCAHPAATHDIEAYDNPQPMCTETGCGCRPAMPTQDAAGAPEGPAEG